MNRLQHREVVAGLRGYDVVRVRHLQRLAIPLDAPGDVADAADRELPLNESPLGVEEDEVDAPGVVLTGDLVRCLGIAARRWFVPQHTDGERRDRAGHGARDSRLGSPVDDTCRGMPQQVDDAWLGNPWRQAHSLLEQHGDARAHTCQRLGGGEEWCQYARTHRVDAGPLSEPFVNG